MSSKIFNEDFKNIFLTNHFSQNYLFKSGMIENPSTIMSLEILNKMLSIKNIWNNKNFIMVLDKKGINYTNYSSLSLDVSGNNYRPDINKVQNLISRGASIVLNDIEKHNSGLLGISAELQSLTQGRCQGNLYFSMESHQAFGPHCDEHDVFAIHFEGEKVWNIYQNVERNPINHPMFKYEPEERIKRAGKLIDQVTLKPGDLLYLPRGQYHDALASKNGAIHIAFGLTYFKSIDLMSNLWEKFILSDFMRKDIRLSNNNDINNFFVNFSKELELIVTSNETKDILSKSIKNWPYAIDEYSLVEIVSEGRSYEVLKSIKLNKEKNDLYITNGKDKVKVPSKYSKLTEYIINQRSITQKSLILKFRDIPVDVINECIESLKKMQVII